MANQAAKDAAQRRRRAALIYGAIALVVNALYYAARYVWLKDPISGWMSWAAQVILWICYAVSGFALVEAQAAKSVDELMLDLYGLAIAVQLGSLYTSWAWYLLLIIPGYAGYKAWSACRSMAAQARAMLEAQRQAMGQAAGAGGPRSEKAQAKKERQAQHGRKVMYQR